MRGEAAGQYGRTSILNGPTLKKNTYRHRKHTVGKAWEDKKRCSLQSKETHMSVDPQQTRGKCQTFYICQLRVFQSLFHYSKRNTKLLKR